MTNADDSTSRNPLLLTLGDIRVSKANEVGGQCARKRNIFWEICEEKVCEIASVLGAINYHLKRLGGASRSD